MQCCCWRCVHIRGRRLTLEKHKNCTSSLDISWSLSVVLFLCKLPANAENFVGRCSLELERKGLAGVLRSVQLKNIHITTTTTLPEICARDEVHQERPEIT